jgi:hypothetical protein
MAAIVQKLFFSSSAIESALASGVAYYLSKTIEQKGPYLALLTVITDISVKAIPLLLKERIENRNVFGHLSHAWQCAVGLSLVAIFQCITCRKLELKDYIAISGVVTLSTRSVSVITRSCQAYFAPPDASRVFSASSSQGSESSSHSVDNT